MSRLKNHEFDFQVGQNKKARYHRDSNEGLQNKPFRNLYPYMRDRLYKYPTPHNYGFYVEIDTIGFAQSGIGIALTLNVHNPNIKSFRLSQSKSLSASKDQIITSSV
jgi:hypothetical protein